MRRDVVLATLAAAIIAAAVLFLVFRSADARIRRQTGALLEAARHDGLTGLPNHGAIVGVLAERVESARENDRAVAIAIVDIDNFRLLNETYGHSAGDRALLSVAEVLRDTLPSAITTGRYGPDEFLVIADGLDMAALGVGLSRLTTALADLSLQFGASERLPVTVSAGVAAYPDHADSVTALLSVAAVTLSDAKSSGGDVIRYADQKAGASEERAGFDVLQGLVIAIDTKDRYTKRHSEDVARYATFLAREVGLDDALLQTVQMAGLLHDVGKIGIPDDILRKPGELTSSELLVVQQHVALGDAIVRGVPNLDTVRSAIRFHHERWDGRGYLERLEGDQIPLIARLIAVGDVFSAMTTSRPYRRALSAEEALRRLGDAAGSQLDEYLVAAFINAIETAADPPLPGQDLAGARLWLPRQAVA
jgi:diguanylate cyclase (GGDEF)-like protein